MPVWGLSILAALAWGAENPLPPPPAEAHVEFSADHVDYDRATEQAHLKGRVVVKESTWTLKGDEIWLDMDDRLAWSDRYILMHDGVSALHGDSGRFNFADHTGYLEHASAGIGDWRVHARSLTLDAQKRLSFRSADFTSCSYDPKPHYHFHASRMSLVPDSHLFASNVLFYAGKVPIFYFPVFYKSLGKSPFLGFKFRPGYDKRNGAFLKGVMVNQHSETWRSKLFLDYFTTMGIGAGGEIHHRDTEDSRGVLSGYRIHENGADNRWIVIGDVYQGLPHSLAVQGRMQLMSDANFNNDYARSSPFPITAYLLNNAALVHRAPQLTTRLSYSRQDDFVSTHTFVKTSESAPRLDLQSAQLTFLGLPWLNTLSGFASNDYARGRSYLSKTAGATWEGTRVFSLSRSLRLTPRAQYNQTYYNRLDAAAGPLYDATVGRWQAGATLRWMNLAGALDITQTYARRLTANSFTDDAAASDHGVESNLLSVTQAYRPVRTVYAKVNSGYDFRVFRNRALGWRDRVQPIITDVIYTPRATFNLTLRNDYLISSRGNRNRNCIFSGTWGDELRTFATVGAGYNAAEPDRYFVNTEAGWSDSTGTWHLTGALRSVVYTPGSPLKLHSFYAFDKELTIIRHWHDFYTRIGTRFRPGNVNEVNFRIDMKFGSYNKDRRIVHDWESEWFPERAHAAEDRP